MYSKFLSLNPEKRERIINAALKEFSRKGYDDASTNEIVKEAEISKGLLFHYFRNKKQLYIFLYDYCMDIGTKEYIDKIDSADRDLFNRIRRALKLKWELLQKYPDIFAFMESAYWEKSKEVQPYIEKSLKSVMDSSYAKIFGNLDTSQFREGVDLKRAINVIIWTLNGFTNEVYNKEAHISSNPETCKKLFNEADVYLEMLKNSFYK